MRIGVDIGGTSVKIGFIDNYKIINKFEIPTKKETLFDDIFNFIKNNCNLNNVEMIGFGIPGNVKDNYIIKMPNVGLSEIDLNQISAQYTNIIIKSSNDANCAALGEALYKNEYESSYFITLGTGVGGGYVLNGKVVDGFHSACGEIGHIYVDHINEYSCTCGLKGCVETVASATGIVRLAKDYKDKYKTNIDFNNISAKTIIDSARENDELGLFVIDYVAKSLARVLSIISVTNDVECFYIGGGVSKAGDILIDKIKEYYQKYSFYACKKTIIKLACLGNDAGMLGAAYL